MQSWLDTQSENTNRDNNSQLAFAVSEVNALVAEVVQSGFPKPIRVRGEISNLSVASSGHRYFSLKDAQSVIACALFKQSALRVNTEYLKHLKNGDEVEVLASLTVYKPQGRYQLIVSDLEPAGFGRLAEAFIALKNKLISEGLTASERKKPIPKWSQKIGVITSATGAALHDVLTTLKRRAPFIPIEVYPSLVQGEGAEKNLLSALDRAESGNNSVILLVRGGGSLEDLQAFNSETLARAVFACQTPIISGVGHETDVSITDFVADVRAPTPTAAAELASPDKEELLADIRTKYQRLYTKTIEHYRYQHSQLGHVYKRLERQNPNRQLFEKRQRLDDYERALLNNIKNLYRFRLQYVKQQFSRLQSLSPKAQFLAEQKRLMQGQQQLVGKIKQRLKEQQIALQNKTEKLFHLTQTRLEKTHNQLQLKEEKLVLLNPLAVLERGYAVVFDEAKQIKRHAADIKTGENLQIKLADGNALVSVLKVDK